MIPHRFNGQIQAATSKKEIVAIARDLGIAPGIVAGRYQFLTGRWKVFNDLRKKFQ